MNPRTFLQRFEESADMKPLDQDVLDALKEQAKSNHRASDE